MPRFSPTVEGFRIAFRRPSLGFAEIAWRWSLGVSGSLLLVFAVIDYFQTLPVSNLDADLLTTRQPLLVWRAVMHIFRGSLNRATLAALFGLGALSFLWIVAASIGRLAIVRALIDGCNAPGRDVSADNGTQPAASQGSAAFRSLIRLNFLRALTVLAALLALVGSAIIANLASPDANPQPALAFLIFLALAAIIAISWITLNWLLSFASIFVMRNGEDTVGAIYAALSLLSARLGTLLAVSIWNLLAHFAAFVIAAGVASMVLAFVSIVPAELVVGAIILVTLVYFAVVDWLYIARLAGYVCIAQMPEDFTPSAISQIPPAPEKGSSTGAPPQTAVDRDEPILSDLPGLAFLARS